MIASSIQILTPSGRPNGVTPPISIPVTSTVSSAEANETFLTPSRLRTSPLTSRRVLASAKQTARSPIGRREETRMALADWSRGMSYAAQNAAVSASSGSQGSTS